MAGHAAVALPSTPVTPATSSGHAATGATGNNNNNPNSHHPHHSNNKDQSFFKAPHPVVKPLFSIAGGGADPLPPSPASDDVDRNSPSVHGLHRQAGRGLSDLIPPTPSSGKSTTTNSSLPFLNPNMHLPQQGNITFDGGFSPVLMPKSMPPVRPMNGPNTRPSTAIPSFATSLPFGQQQQQQPIKKRRSHSSSHSSVSSSASTQPTTPSSTQHHQHANKNSDLFVSMDTQQQQNNNDGSDFGEQDAIEQAQGFVRQLIHYKESRDQIERDLNSCKLELEHCQVSLSQLTKDRHRIDEDLRNANTRYRDQETAHKKVVDELELLKKEKAAKQTEFEALQATCHQLELQLGETRKDLEYSRAQVETLNEFKSKQEKELEEWKGKVERANEQLTAASDEMTGKCVDLAESKSAYTELKTTLEKQLAEKSGLCTQLDARIQELLVEQQQTAQMNQQLSFEMERMKQDMLSKMEEYQKKEGEHEELKRTLDMMESKFDVLQKSLSQLDQLDVDALNRQISAEMAVEKELTMKSAIQTAIQESLSTSAIATFQQDFQQLATDVLQASSNAQLLEHQSDLKQTLLSKMDALLEKLDQKPAEIIPPQDTKEYQHLQEQYQQKMEEQQKIFAGQEQTWQNVFLKQKAKYDNLSSERDNLLNQLKELKDKHQQFMNESTAKKSNAPPDTKLARSDSKSKDCIATRPLSRFSSFELDRDEDEEQLNLLSVKNELHRDLQQSDGNAKTSSRKTVTFESPIVSDEQIKALPSSESEVILDVVTSSKRNSSSSGKSNTLRSRPAKTFQKRGRS